MGRSPTRPKARPKASVAQARADIAARADKRYKIKRNANQPPPAHQQQQQQQQHAASSASCRPGTPQPG